jgi:PIN domain nuclease of toxin-antitoxin system
MCCVLDACALLAFLNDEEGAEKIEDLLNQPAAYDVSVSMSIINLLRIVLDSPQPLNYPVNLLLLITTNLKQ